MTEHDCPETRKLIQADIDGELMPPDTARMAAHLKCCAECSRLRAGMLALVTRIHDEAPRYTASASLRNAVLASISAETASEAPARRGARERLVTWWRQLARSRPGPFAPFGAGFALAACLSLFFVLPHAVGPRDEVVAGHIRALQPNHLMDVVSTDQHTVKPWFDGRLDFAPPVKDLKAVGFPLAGGRLDYLGGRQVAALVYRRGQHIIDMFVWPDAGLVDQGAAAGNRDGYNFLRWIQDDMIVWAVSDLSKAELSDFVDQWRASP